MNRILWRSSKNIGNIDIQQQRKLACDVFQCANSWGRECEVSEFWKDVNILKNAENQLQVHQIASFSDVSVFSNNSS